MKRHVNLIVHSNDILIVKQTMPVVIVISFIKRAVLKKQFLDISNETNVNKQSNTTQMTLTEG